jgi:hypothetical protein
MAEEPQSEPESSPQAGKPESLRRSPTAAGVSPAVASPKAQLGPEEKLPLLGPKKPLRETWSLDRAREGLRSTLSKWLLAVLTLLVVAALTDVSELFFTQRSAPVDLVNDLRLVLEILVPPVVGLVGAVTGFYFGTRATENSSSSQNGASKDDEQW